MIHPLSDCQTNSIGANTRIWQYTVILPGAIIGNNCNICSHCFIENDVVIGNNVTIKCGVQIWDGMSLGNDVFIGPNATFCNDLYPKSGNKEFNLMKTWIKNGAVIGANATILPGITIGERSIVGAGATVTKNVPDGIIVKGTY